MGILILLCICARKGWIQLPTDDECPLLAPCILCLQPQTVEDSSEEENEKADEDADELQDLEKAAKVKNSPFLAADKKATE